MPSKWIYEPRDALWVACCRAAYERMVCRFAKGCRHETDDRRLPELLRTVDLTAADFARDVQAASDGAEPRRWPDLSPVTVTEVEDLPEGQYPVCE